MLADVKALQNKLRASDEATAECLTDYARSNVEAALNRAIAVMQLRGQKRDVSPAIKVTANGQAGESAGLQSAPEQKQVHCI